MEYMFAAGVDIECFGQRERFQMTQFSRPKVITR